jgi:hypothetical protein
MAETNFGRNHWPKLTTRDSAFYAGSLVAVVSSGRSKSLPFSTSRPRNGDYSAMWLTCAGDRIVDLSFVPSEYR